jgi:hypothetical protein
MITTIIVPIFLTYHYLSLTTTTHYNRNLLQTLEQAGDLGVKIPERFMRKFRGRCSNLSE